MKLVGVREAQAQLSGLVKRSQREQVILTRHGQPIAVLTGVEGKDLEEVLLAEDRQFRELIERRRRYQGPLVSHEELSARADRDLKREAKARLGRTTRRRTAKK